MWRPPGMSEDKRDGAGTQAFLERAVVDWAAGISAVMVHLGDKLGLYRAMAGAGPLTSAELARRTATAERYVREWLGNQAAGGYVVYHPGTGRYELPDEHAAFLVDEDAPGFVLGGFDMLAAAWAAEPRIRDAFRTGDGVGWHEHDARLYAGMRRLSWPSFRAYLTTEWIPALDGVEDRLRAGGRVADVGCGHGASTTLMAAAFPRSHFTGYDDHDASIAAARKAAAEAGVGDRVAFEVAGADDFPADGFDLVTLFDCLHDFGDPVGAARHIRDALAPGGVLLVVEPNAPDAIEDHVGPLVRALYGVSTIFCTATSLSQDVGRALGAAAGEARLRDVLVEAGFAHVRRATETPFQMVLEARP